MTDQTLGFGLQTLRTEREGLNALITAMSGEGDASFREAFCAASNILLELRRKRKGRVIVCGIGKSGHIGRKLASTFASTGTPAFFVHAAEASHGDLGMIEPDDVVLALSNSGETRELSDIIAYCARFSITLLAITSGAGSTLAKAANITLLLPPVPEACNVTRAPTTSALMALAVGDALAVALLRSEAFGETDFKTYHPGGKLGSSFRRVTDIAKDRPLPLTHPSAKLTEVVEAITVGGLGIVGVCDAKDKLLGVVTDGDLRRAMRGSLDGLTATNLMSHDPVVVEPDQLAAQALGLLNTRMIQAAFIVKDDRPMGVLHLHDFLREGLI